MVLRRFAFILLVTATVLAGCAKSAQQYYQSGNKYFDQKKFKEAVVEYRNAIQKNPRFGEAHLQLAESYVRAGDPRNAIREYINAADLLPANKEAQLKAGAFLMLAGRDEEAKARAEKVLKMDPKNLEARLLRGNATWALKDVDGAIRQVEEAIQLDPKSARSYTMLGSIETSKGDTVAAEKAFRQAIEFDPKSVVGHLAFGQFLAGQRRPFEAEASFKKAYEIDPKNQLAARTLAAFYMVSNRAPEAEPYLKALAGNSKEPAPTIALADYYVMMRRVDEAVALLNKAAANKDGYVDATLRLAVLEYGQGKTAQAHKSVDGLLARDAKNPRALIIKARFLLVEKKVDEALARTKAAVAADPRSVQGQYMLGTLYADRNRPDEAIAAFNEVLKLNPRAVAAQLQLARLQMAKGARGPALQMAEAASAAQPDNPLARLLLVRTLIANGDLARAESELKALQAKYPRAATVQTSLGVLLASKRDLAGARLAFERALQFDANSDEALAGLVTLDVVAKKLPDARARVEARLAKTPNDKAVLLLAARTYAAGGDMAKTEATLLKTLELAPDTLEAYGMLGQVYLAQQKADQARQMFAGLAARQSKPVASETMIGMILEMQGKRSDAQKQYEKVMQLDARAPIAANNLAWMHAESGDNLDIALQLAQTAKAGLPDSPEVDDTIGWVYYKKDLVSLALPSLQAAVSRSPQNPNFRYHLGMALVKSGDLIGGRQSIEKALQLNPNFSAAADARKALARLR